MSKTKWKNRKGMYQLVWMLGSVVVIFIFGVVMLSFATKFLATAPAKTSAKMCSSTLQMKINYNAEVDGIVADAKLDEPEYGIKKIFSGQNVKNFFVGDEIRGVNNFMDGSATVMKNLIQPICHTQETACIGDAADVARCLHARAADTFYALLGFPTSTPKLGIEQWQTQPMYHIQVKITAPGKVKVRGPCSAYFSNYYDPESGQINDPTCKGRMSELQTVGESFEEDPDKWKTPCGDTEIMPSGKEYCTIYFTTVDLTTMALAGIEYCSNTAAGPLDKSCLCFPKASLGYRVGNGIQLIETGHPILSTYTITDYISYSTLNENLGKDGSAGVAAIHNKRINLYGPFYSYEDLLGCTIGTISSDTSYYYIETEKLFMDRGSLWWNSPTGEDFPGFENTNDKNFYVSTQLDLNIIGGVKIVNEG